jgi:uncharacterized repeat protein (TIGR03803 family)
LVTGLKARSLGHFHLDFQRRIFMRNKTLFRGSRALITICNLLLLAASLLAASDETIVHSFNKSGRDGVEPNGGLISDAVGNLYGTTTAGGTHRAGAVFELTPAEDGSWTEKLLHSFNNNGVDGAYPCGKLVFDGVGNLYGTTSQGGGRGSGVVFELSLGSGGNWTEKVLYSFNSSTGDGAPPLAGLTLDSAGNLYGTTNLGGTFGYGTVIELSPAVGGGWTEKVLHSFGHLSDGTSPVAGVIRDLAGNLYGTTISGAINGNGIVFELSPQGSGWTEKVLYAFANGADGSSPWGGLTLDAAGNLYGTTEYGGANGWGTVFKLTQVGGSWMESVLHSFNLDGTDGTSPVSALAVDSSGRLYGTTEGGGAFHFGVVFELFQNGGNWTETVLHSFGSGADGASPTAGVLVNAAGSLYGTTVRGGPFEVGTVFEVAP